MRQEYGEEQEKGRGGETGPTHLLIESEETYMNGNCKIAFKKNATVETKWKVK